MWIPTDALGGAGTTGHKSDARFAGHLAPGVGHVGDATFLPTDDQIDLVLHVVERIERGQIALSRHAEDGVDTVEAQAVHEDLSARAEIGRIAVGHDLNLDKFVQKNRVFLALGFVRVFLVHIGN